MMQVGAIAASLLALAPPQAPTPPEKWRVAKPETSRAMGVAFARCAVSENRRAIVAALAQPFGTDDFRPIKNASPSQCVFSAGGGWSSLQGPTVLIRGLLFEALYAHDLGTRSTVFAFDQVPSQNYAVVGVDSTDVSQRRDYRALMKIGECVARAGPVEVQVLLASRVSSKAEADAIREISAVWKNCMPGHRDLPFSVEMMRATVVEPFYRLLQRSTGRGDAALFAGQAPTAQTPR